MGSLTHCRKVSLERCRNFPSSDSEHQVGVSLASLRETLTYLEVVQHKRRRVRCKYPHVLRLPIVKKVTIHVLRVAP